MFAFIKQAILNGWQRNSMNDVKKDDDDDDDGLTAISQLVFTIYFLARLALQTHLSTFSSHNSCALIKEQLIGTA